MKTHSNIEINHYTEQIFLLKHTKPEEKSRKITMHTPEKNNTFIKRT